MAKVKTVRIRQKDHPEGSVLINASDYDEEVHELLDAPAPKKQEAGDGAAAPGLPAGYEVEHAGGGYYHLIAPDGETIEGPDNGKWRGAASAEQAARDHAFGPEAPRG